MVGALRVKDCAFRTTLFLHCWCENVYIIFGIRQSNTAAISNVCAAGLLECVRQLQDASFAECRAEDLQPDG